MLKHWIGIAVVLSGIFSSLSFAKVVHYELVATQGKVNLSGKEEVDFALMLNGSIPAPTLTFQEGDDAEIVVKNQIPDQELSIHWHGILLPPEMDGVAYVNSPPILSGESFTFRFKIRQSGTYWYHSHTNVQEQKGIYGAFIIQKAGEELKYDREKVVVLSDWSDENATQILKNLRKDGDYYLYKKGTMRSWLGAIQAGKLDNFLYNEWTRMGGMDFSDVGYDAFLMNGKREVQLVDARPAERIRVRVINAAASTYFYVSLGQTPMQMVSADGVDIQPVAAKEFMMGMAETYDFIFQVPDDRNYELRVTAQDGTGTTSGWIGNPHGEKVSAPVKPFPDMYATMEHGGAHHGGHGSADHSGHGNTDHSGHHSSHHSSHGDLRKVETLTVDQLRAREKSAFPAGSKTHDVKLVLDGDMSRYIWHINGKAIHEDRTIEVREGDVVRFHFVNQTMMHHPMHLHGHFFRVLNENGEYSPWKHTVDVPPHGSRTIEFKADEPGEWMLHCHNLYHLKTGMARVVKYMSYKPTPEIAHLQKHDPHLHDHWYTYGMLEAATNHIQGQFRLTQTWNEFYARFETRKDFSWGGEGDLFYRRWQNRFLYWILGGVGFENSYRGTLGVGYILPMLIRTQVLLDHHGDFRVDASKRFQWTKTIFTDADVTWRQKQESEFEISLMYSPVWTWAAGLKFTGESIGVGIQVQF
jgi:FtsP/CotA-like multicopper oxidase with cupredoxin domain